MGCTQNDLVIPYTTNQLIARSTDLNYTLFTQGYYDGNCLKVDNNFVSVGSCGDTNASTSWSDLTGFPVGCSAGQAVQIIGSTLTCVDLSVDTNFETAGYGDLNMDLNYVQDGDNVNLLKVTDLQIANEEGGFDKVYHAGSFILNGMSENKQSLYTIVEGGEVYLETEAIGGGDLEYIFNESSSILDCTTGSGIGGRARVLLTQGTATSPQINYVYVTDGSGVATIHSSTSFPTGTIAMIATIAIGDDVRTASDGPAHLQRWTMSLKHDNGSVSSGDVDGTLYWIQRKLRELGAKYESGIALTTDDTGGIIDLTAGGGIVYQLHPNTWEERQISVDGAYVANASGTGTLTNYEKLMDLASIAELQDGSTITTNKYFSVTVWGSMNSSDQNGNQSKLFFNLPSGFYLSSSDAIADVDNYDVRTVPSEFSTTAFLIGRLVMQRTVAGNVFVGDGVYSLLGQSLGSQGGGTGSVASNSFSDAQFNVFNDTDPTKVLDLDISGVTTGTTRTLSVPDASGIIALTSDITAHDENIYSLGILDFDTNNVLIDWNMNGLDIVDVNNIDLNIIWADQNMDYGTIFCKDGNIIIGYLGDGFIC